nr:EAL domain-containing protein [Shewanella sp. CG12_big_fil_rev_8_21_14_0_65_47_15]
MLKSDLSWLDALYAQVLKLDMTLLCDIDKEKPLAVAEILRICLELNTRVLAEGVEIEAELNYLVALSLLGYRP